MLSSGEASLLKPPGKVFLGGNGCNDPFPLPRAMRGGKVGANIPTVVK